MFKQVLMPQFRIFWRFAPFFKVTVTTSILLNILVNPSFAGDPFRSREPHKIGDRTEAVFNAIFQQGNYPAAKDALQKAVSSEPNEPLIYALQASLAYQNQDQTNLAKYSRKTLETGQNLIASDPLRGNLYTAVGHFLEGAVILKREGTVNGAPLAFSRLRKVYTYLDRAEEISANDPELNLIRGYMDLMLAVNLPFTSPDDAINRLEKNAAPGYLVDRGIALAYRDLKQHSQALDYVNRALKTTADNPEIYYLKAQILHEKGKKEKSQDLIKEAIIHFDKALAKKSQLPANLVKQIEYERNQAVSGQ
ncbi:MULTISPECIES: Sll0314/Alr1548 family TPR repeat-containing protein [Nostocales]|uniref:Sll0314/Alr1548 family TPR repeat-containing protein n=1 Tax=Nostocales TaxID=1161 RepID=UPI00029B75F8|nr:MULTISPECIES: Sll0314/Alr1548 family TPR repeat-containing protein [Nostocales]AFW97146.1 TPR repeat-containing protein [Anabaena sp. 90]MTJ19068.1 tetratricopeptide repeat protein [Dolichospermum sp. UHCC 0299]MTJ23593.1 tetratricopeptide repeat protein [Dolichospermum sp. UHCC 0352]